MIRRVTRLGLTLAVAASALLVAASPASAALDSDPDPTWMTNGIVYALTQGGNTIYAAGKFKAVRPCPTTTSCSGTIPTVDVGAFDATTGAGISSFRVDVGVAGDGSKVYALAVLNGKLYIGGQFSSVDGQPRLNMAVLDLSSGALDPVAPQVGVDTTSYVRGMITYGDRLYIAGKFSSVNGSGRQKLAAFTSDGALDPNWRPRVSQGIARSFAPTCDGRLIVGGSFGVAAGSGGAYQARKRLAIFDPASGALDQWSPDNANMENGLASYDIAVDPDCNSMYVGMGASNHLIKIDLSDDLGNILWDIHTGGNVQTVAVYGQRVLFGGHFTNTPAAPDSTAKVQRIRFATVDHNGNALSDWTPEFSGKFYGPWDILTNETAAQVWVGGQFTYVNAVEQDFVARFSNVPLTLP
jgi:hypothetical protein